ncbi:MAG TPA: mechanosensitive ion channel family protein [Bacteroidales bacterium]|nr:mechanosensitive ion channel family protein [Bacteroidales bacterium]HRX98271.1 mechanosensitive ion channel family protein [Bacteroidales bacterium]
MYERLIASFNHFWMSVVTRTPDIIVSLTILIAFIIIGKIFYRMFRIRIQKRWKDSLVASFISEFLKWSFYLIGLTIALFNLGLGGIASSLMAGAGVTAIIVGFAFKDIAENFLAGILLAINRPFKIGDIIEVSGIKGPVKGLDLRTTQIKMVDGRDIYIPNATVITNVFTNYTRDGLLRLDFELGVDTYTDVEMVRELIIKHIGVQKDVLKKPQPNVTLESFGESSIGLKVTFWIDIFKDKKEDQSLLGEPVKSRIMREIKDILIEKNVNMPAHIIEHKMYDPKDTLKIRVENDKS